MLVRDKHVAIHEGANTWTTNLCEFLKLLSKLHTQGRMGCRPQLSVGVVCVASLPKVA